MLCMAQFDMRTMGLVAATCPNSARSSLQRLRASGELSVIRAAL